MWARKAARISAWRLGVWGLSIRSADRGASERVPDTDPRPDGIWALDASIGRDAAGLSPAGGGGDSGVSRRAGDRAGGSVGTQRWSGYQHDDRVGGARAL